MHAPEAQVVQSMTTRSGRRHSIREIRLAHRGEGFRATMGGKQTASLYRGGRDGRGALAASVCVMAEHRRRFSALATEQMGARSAEISVHPPVAGLR